MEYDQAFVISHNLYPVAVILRRRGDQAPLPNQILDAYAREYALERANLRWALADIIPMPEVKSED